MQIIDEFEEKKVYHILLESSNKNILFVLPDIHSLKHFDPVLDFLKHKFSKCNMKSGLLETLKNRGKHKDYVFINIINKENLREYNIIVNLPEIYDYSYFVPNILGFNNIPNIQMTDQFNYVLNYYNLGKYIILNVDKYMNILSCARYIDFLDSKGIPAILIGYAIKNAEIVNLTKSNPVVIYQKNKPLIYDLIKKSAYVVGNDKPELTGIKYKFIDFEDEVNLFESLK